MESFKEYTFVIIALGHLGDTILVEPLCRNIKYNFPKSKIIFIVNETFKDIPLGFEHIDEIIGYDKKKRHKGLFGFLKFITDFSFKNIDYAIITHPHERSIFIAKAIGAKNIISLPIKLSLLNFFINKKVKCSLYEKKHTYKGYFNSKYLTGMCSLKNYPVIYNRKNIDILKIIQKFNLPNNYIVLSATSKETIKDWDYNEIRKFILKNKYSVALIGTEKANIIANKLINDNVNFIDLTNKTTITELGAIIKAADICISVDTGTFHLSYAQNVKTIGLFFNSGMTIEWAPKESARLKLIKGNKYENSRSVVCTKNITAEDVLDKMREFENTNNKCMSVL